MTTPKDQMQQRILSTLNAMDDESGLAFATSFLQQSVQQSGTTPKKLKSKVNKESKGAEELKLDQEKFLYPLLKPSAPPKSIRFRDLNGKVEELDWKTLQEKLNSQSPVKIKGWAGNYYVKRKEDLKTIQEGSLPLYQNKHFALMVQFAQHAKGYREGPEMMDSDQVRLMHDKTMDCIQLVQLANPLNVCGFSKKAIKKGSILIYGGLCSFKHETVNDYVMAMLPNGTPGQYDMAPGTNHYSVYSDEYRDFSGWLAHLPEERDVNENMQFSKDKIKRKLATANFKHKMLFITDLKIVMPVLVATRDIEANEILGFDYSLPYWLAKKISPVYVDKQGSIIDKSNYRHTEFQVLITNVTSGASNTRSFIPSSLSIPELEEALKKEDEDLRTIQFYEPPLKTAAILERASLEKALLNRELFVSIPADGILNKTIVDELCKKLTSIFVELELETDPNVLGQKQNIQKLWDMNLEFDGRKPFITYKEPFPIFASDLIQGKLKEKGLNNCISFAKAGDILCYMTLNTDNAYLLAKRFGINVNPFKTQTQEKKAEKETPISTTEPAGNATSSVAPPGAEAPTGLHFAFARQNNTALPASTEATPSEDHAVTNDTVVEIVDNKDNKPNNKGKKKKKKNRKK